MLFLSGNGIIGRAVHQDVPPVGLSFWRWVVASLVMLPFSWRHLRRQSDLVRQHWRLMVLLTFGLILLGNTLIYVALNFTTAINAGVVAVSRPVVIAIIAWLLYRVTVTRWQVMGIGTAMAGVILVISRGDPEVLASLQFNRGDLLLVLATVAFCTYQVLISRLPKTLHPLVVLQVTMTLGAFFLAPVYLCETLFLRPVPFNAISVVTILYVAIFASALAVAAINTGISLIGIRRAGVFNYLQLVFLTIMAVIFLGEVVETFHIAGIGLILLGIYINTLGKSDRNLAQNEQQQSDSP